MNNKFHIFILILLTRLLCYNRLILKRSRNEAICEFFSSHLHRLEAVLIDGWVVEKDADRRTHILGSQMANVIFETVPLIPIEWIPSFNFELRFKSCSRAFVRDELRTFWCSSPSTYICKNSLCISEKTHICKHVYSGLHLFYMETISIPYQISSYFIIIWGSPCYKQTV